MEMKMYTFSHHDHIEILKQFWDAKKYSLKVEFIKRATYTLWAIRIKTK